MLCKNIQKKDKPLRISIITKLQGIEENLLLENMKAWKKEEFPSKELVLTEQYEKKIKYLKQKEGTQAIKQEQNRKRTGRYGCRPNSF